MKKIEDRNEIEIQVQFRRSVPELIKGEAWGDNLPIIRLGSEVGFVDEHGIVYPSIEAAFVANHDGCKCLATASLEQAINKIALFSVLVAMKAPPSKIAELMFHGEIFIFEMFSDMMESRRLIEHAPGDLVEGYNPLELTDEGEAGLRMCLQSDMVELPFDKNVAYQSSFPELLAIETTANPADVPDTTPKVLYRDTQACHDRRMNNWLQTGVFKMSKGGVLTQNRKLRRYSADELRRARQKTYEARRRAESEGSVL